MHSTDACVRRARRYLHGHSSVVLLPVIFAFIPRTSSQVTTVGKQSSGSLPNAEVIADANGATRRRRAGLRQLLYPFGRTCASKRTTPACKSIVAILLFAPGTSSLLCTNFSTANTTPSLQRKPITVPEFSTALLAYST